jgi:hypothetical protein
MKHGLALRTFIILQSTKICSKNAHFYNYVISDSVFRSADFEVFILFVLQYGTGIQNSVGGIASRLWTTRSDVRITAVARNFSLSHNAQADTVALAGFCSMGTGALKGSCSIGTRVLTGSCSMGTGVLAPEKSGRDLKLTTNMYMLPRCTPACDEQEILCIYLGTRLGCAQ